MRRYMRSCPNCGTMLDPKTIPVLHTHFACPFCGAPLRVAANYPGAISVTSIILSIALTFYSGFRGLAFAPIAILGFWMILVVLSAIVGLIWPARVELRLPRPSNDFATPGVESESIFDRRFGRCIAGDIDLDYDALCSSINALVPTRKSSVDATSLK